MRNRLKRLNLQLFSNNKMGANIKTELKVSNNSDSEVATLHLYGDIRKANWFDDEDDVISSKRVRNALKDIGDKDVNVHINSGGGDVFESIAIHNTLKQHNGKVNIIVDALAGSGASIIAMAGDSVKMFDTSMMMIHKAWTIVMGNADELRKQADDMDKIDSSVKASYKSRFVGTEEELEDLVADESWLTAEECLAFGFCDKKEEDKDNKPEPQANVKENLFNKYKNDNLQKQEPVNTKKDLLDKFNNGGNE